MKITHPFVVLIIGGSLLAGMAWWWSKRDAAPQADSVTAPTTAETDPEGRASSSPAVHAHTEAQGAAPPIEGTSRLPDAAPPRQPQPTELPWEVEAKRLVTDGLKDPGSAMFRAIRAVGDDQVCGQVNAKNSFGGYVGYRWFWIKGMEREDPTVMVDGDTTLAQLLCDPSKS